MIAFPITQSDVKEETVNDEVRAGMIVSMSCMSWKLYETMLIRDRLMNRFWHEIGTY